MDSILSSWVEVIRKTKQYFRLLLRIASPEAMPSFNPNFSTIYLLTAPET